MNTISMIKSLRNKYKSMIQMIGVDPKLWPLNTKPQHDGSAHIEIEGNNYHYVVTERGREFSREITTNIDEILYLLISTITFHHATLFELNNRNKNQDFRYILFFYEELLMKKISQDYFNKLYDYHESLLKHPYPIPKIVNKKINSILNI